MKFVFGPGVKPGTQRMRSGFSFLPRIAFKKETDTMEFRWLCNTTWLEEKAPASNFGWNTVQFFDVEPIVTI